MKKLLTLLTALLIFSSTFAQKAASPWTDFEESEIQFRIEIERPIVPQKYRTVKLDKTAFEAAMTDVQKLGYGQGRKAKKEMMFPMPDGSNQVFKIYESPIMHPDLAAKFPSIKVYAGYGVDDPTAYVRFGTSESGFHAYIRSARTGSTYIDTYSKNDTEHYISYNRKNYVRADAEFTCHLHEEEEILKSQITNEHPQLRIGDCQIRKYRLAVAADSRYSAFHGGTVPLVMAEINRAVARINSVFEIDFSVTFELVPDNDELIFTNTTTDPYRNSNGGGLLNTNNTTINNRIGVDNYDIGHLFTTGGGGLAGLGVVCRDGDKADGFSGLGNPTGDAFWVEYVCHEMGHQFAANHSFNNACGGNRSSSNAVEPGSGSTIMSYIGICPPNLGVGGEGDPYFHAQSLDEVYDFITRTNDCAEKTNAGNNIPEAIADGDRILPVSTPFVLTGSANDDAGDNLTYTWEQMDPEIGSMPPDSDNRLGPMFRFINPDETPERYFPNLPDLVQNISPTWEVLPSVSRDMSFRFVVRDNAPGNGCVGIDDIELTFDDSAGPFLVQSPNVATDLWLVGEMQTVRWDVANTNQAPVSCGQVDILLSKDGGLTYPITLASGVPNDGTHDLVVPQELTANARVMIKCSDSYFFDISNADFDIEFPPEPTFFITTANESVTLCNNEDAVYNLSFSTLLDFSEIVDLTVTGVPMGANAAFGNSAFNPDMVSSTQLTISSLQNVPSGVYPLTVTGTSPSKTKTLSLELSVFNGVPAQPQLVAPADGEPNVFFDDNLMWNADVGTEFYVFEIATAPNFGLSTIVSQTISGSSFNLGGLNLQNDQIYYWRISPSNPCGMGVMSEVFAFRTFREACSAVQSVNTPIEIAITDPGQYTDQISITGSAIISRVNVLLEFEHLYVGDLSATLVSPSGTEVVLFERPGATPDDNFGCSGDNLQVVFDDDAALTHDEFGAACQPNASPYSISGVFQPLGTLSSLQAENAQGNWTLQFSDSAADDGGALVDWQIEICEVPTAVVIPNLITNNVLLVKQNEGETIANSLLSANSSGNGAEDIRYIIRRNVTQGNVRLNGAALAVNDEFTQADINAGRLSYQHGGGSAPTDNFVFDLFNAEGGWLSNQVFNINIQFNTVSVTAAQTSAILCNGDNSGEITVNGSGGTLPYFYSLNGGTFQSNNVFTQLTPGNYIATIRDADGFTQDANLVIVTEPLALMIGTSVVNDMVTVSVSGGTPFYEYSLDGTNFQSSNVFGNVGNGAYMVTVRDANGCSTNTQVVVAVNSLVVSANLLNDISCNGADDARIEVIVAGGNPPYTYSLNGTPVQTSNIFENVWAGSHTITVYDADNFQMNTGQILVTNPPAIIVSTAVNNDMITVDASGGTGVLRYSLNGGAFQNNNTFTGLLNGNYVIAVRDDNGCTASGMATIAVNRVTINVTLIQDNLCFGENIAIIEASASGGTAPYQYSISGGAFQVSNRFENLMPGNYTITTVDDEGFTVTSSVVTVSGPTEINIAPMVAGYNIIINASGGTPSYEYSLDGLNYGADNTFRNNTPDTYTTYVRDANGCIKTDVVSVNVDLLSVNAVISNPINCNGDDDGQVTLTAVGGVPPFEYSLNGTDYQMSNTFSGLPAGNTTFYIRDAGGFTNTTTVNLIEPPALELNAPSFSDGTMTFNATGGTGVYEFSFDGGGFASGNAITNLVVDKDYTVVVRDENGCIKSGTYSVPSVQLSDLDIVLDCAGTNGARIEIFLAGGAAPIQYSLDGTAYQNQRLFTDVPPGDYQVFVRDAAGFEYSFAVPNIPSYPIGIMTDVDGDDVTVSGFDGVAPYMYSVDNGPFGNNNVFLDLPEGNHTLTIRDANDCEISLVVTIASTSAKDIFAQLNFEINPNPSNGFITMKMAQVTNPQLLARVFDNTGKLVFEERFEKFGLNLEKNFDLDLPAGSYYMTIEDGQFFGRKQLVIIK